MELELECIAIEKDEGASAILGHAGFIKTVEDLYEAMVGSVPGIKFGIAFAEASGPRLVRSDGNDDGLKRQAESKILKIAAVERRAASGVVVLLGSPPLRVVRKETRYPNCQACYFHCSHLADIPITRQK